MEQGRINVTRERERERVKGFFGREIGSSSLILEGKGLEKFCFVLFFCRTVSSNGSFVFLVAVDVQFFFVDSGKSNSFFPPFSFRSFHMACQKKKKKRNNREIDRTGFII